MAPENSGEKPSVTEHETELADQQDGGTAGLGEAAASVAAVDSAEPSFQEGMAEDPLPEPLPGQVMSDVKGRCPRKWQVVLNGGCWKQLRLEREECEGIGGYLFKDACYMPVTSPKRKPTSGPVRDQ
jgi:eukaryotic-like serine/threonine-protein kinase